MEPKRPFCIHKSRVPSPNLTSHKSNPPNIQRPLTVQAQYSWSCPIFSSFPTLIVLLVTSRHRSHRKHGSCCCIDCCVHSQRSGPHRKHHSYVVVYRPMPSNSRCLIVYFEVVAKQRVYMSQYETKPSWPNRGAILGFVLRYWGKTRYALEYLVYRPKFEPGTCRMQV
jgi:hypothetical protein